MCFTVIRLNFTFRTEPSFWGGFRVLYENEKEGYTLAKSKGNIDNLKPFKTVEQAREAGRKGGKKSQQVQRKRRKAKECLNMILSLDVTGENNKKFMAQLGIEDEEQQNIMLLMARMYMKAAATGEASAIAKILEIVGDLEANTAEKSAPTININVQPATEKDVENME